MPTNVFNFGPELDRIDKNVQAILAAMQALCPALATLANQETILQDLADIQATLKRLEESPSVGAFNPPPALVKHVPVEMMMSVLQLEVGQTAVGKLTFDEMTPPADGAVASDNTAAVTISLDPTDHITWTAVAVAVTPSGSPANVTYTGTSAPPDVGPAVVPPMMVTVVAVPVAEHGDFDPTHAVITGP